MIILRISRWEYRPLKQPATNPMRAMKGTPPARSALYASLVESISLPLRWAEVELPPPRWQTTML